MMARLRALGLSCTNYGMSRRRRRHSPPDRHSWGTVLRLRSLTHNLVRGSSIYDLSSVPADWEDSPEIYCLLPYQSRARGSRIIRA